MGATLPLNRQGELGESFDVVGLGEEVEEMQFLKAEAGGGEYP
jgi:hypothetical protein